jgi:hypothetical protein
MLRGQPLPPGPEEPFETPLNDLVGTYIGPQDYEVAVTCENEQIICTMKTENMPPMDIVMQKDDKGVLRVQSDTQHYSIGFFHEPESGVDSLMLGTLAFRKQ